MSVVTIFSASYCHGDEIAEKVTQELGYECVSEEIVEEASRCFGVPHEKLIRAMHGPPSFFNNLTRERERSVAYIKAALAECLKKDNVVYHGFAGHLLPDGINHVVKVCVVADRESRLNLAARTKGVRESEAARMIEKDDEQRGQWTQYLFDLGPWDKSLYDIKIPIHTMSVDDAVRMICDNVKKPDIATTSASDQAISDFALAAKVNIALVEKGHDVEVSCQRGNVTITINKFVWRLQHLQEKLKEIAGSVPGVKDIETRKGARVEQPAIYPKYDFQAPANVLLVDDEKEYVLTLSERLRMRDIPAQVAYNGEEALSFVQKEQTDVVVLDLMMPGIHGLDVLRQLKKEHPDTEVIILTGHGSEKDEEVARELGAFAYLQKPVDINKLAQTMKEAYEKIQKKSLPNEESTD